MDPANVNFTFLALVASLSTIVLVGLVAFFKGLLGRQERETKALQRTLLDLNSSLRSLQQHISALEADNLYLKECTADLSNRLELLVDSNKPSSEISPALPPSLSSSSSSSSSSVSRSSAFHSSETPQDIQEEEAVEKKEEEAHSEPKEERDPVVELPAAPLPEPEQVVTPVDVEEEQGSEALARSLSDDKQQEEQEEQEEIVSEEIVEESVVPPVIENDLDKESDHLPLPVIEEVPLEREREDEIVLETKEEPQIQHEEVEDDQSASEKVTSDLAPLDEEIDAHQDLDKEENASNDSKVTDERKEEEDVPLVQQREEIVDVPEKTLDDQLSASDSDSDSDSSSTTSDSEPEVVEEIKSREADVGLQWSYDLKKRPVSFCISDFSSASPDHSDEEGQESHSFSRPSSPPVSRDLDSLLDALSDSDSEEEKKTTPENEQTPQEKDSEATGDLTSSLPLTFCPSSLPGDSELDEKKEIEAEAEEKSLALKKKKEEEEEEKAKLQKRRREAVAKELLSTEENYVQILQNICNLILQPLTIVADTEEQILSTQQIRTIFSTIEVIRNYNQVFLDTIKQVMDDYLKDPEGKELMLGDLLAKSSVWLKTYQSYVVNYASSLACLAKAQKSDQAFRDFLRSPKARLALGHSDLSGLLITPIQRIGRYVMLAEQLLRFTPEGHPDHKDLSTALSLFQKIAMGVNEGQREYEGMEKVFQIVCDRLVTTGSSSSQKKVSDLVVPHRRYVHEGRFYRSVKSLAMPDLLLQKKDMYDVIVFTDVVLLTHPVTAPPASATPSSSSSSSSSASGSGSETAREETTTPVTRKRGNTSAKAPNVVLGAAGPGAHLDAPVPSPFSSSAPVEQIEFKRIVPIADLKVEPYQKDNRGLCLSRSDFSKKFFCRSPEERDRWVEILRTTKEAWLERERSLREAEKKRRTTLIL